MRRYGGEASAGLRGRDRSSWVVAQAGKARLPVPAVEVGLEGFDGREWGYVGKACLRVVGSKRSMENGGGGSAMRVSSEVLLSKETEDNIVRKLQRRIGP